jgi:UDP-N-acetylglucosamine:LPS N-acetylglucosamine transferase
MKLRVPGPVYRVVRPGGKDAHLHTDLIKYPRCLAQAAAALLRARPDAVLSTGPAVAAPVGVVARLMGVRVIFVETGARIHALSKTGGFMRRLAHLYFVQWEELLPAAPRAVFAGRLF